MSAPSPTYTVVITEAQRAALVEVLEAATVQPPALDGWLDMLAVLPHVEATQPGAHHHFFL